MRTSIFLGFVLSLYSFTLCAQARSLSFDGTDDYINLGDNFGFEYTSAFTVEAWFKIAEAEGIYQIVSKLGTGYRGWGLQVHNGVVQGYLISSLYQNDLFLAGTTPVADNKWHHAAMVYDGQGKIELYLDGAIEESNVWRDINGTIMNAGRTFIGAYDASEPGEFFRGMIFEVRIWSTTRSLSQISTYMNSRIGGRQPNLIGYYYLSSKNARDASVSENHSISNGKTGEGHLPQVSNDVPAGFEF